MFRKNEMFVHKKQFARPSKQGKVGQIKENLLTDA